MVSRHAGGKCSHVQRVKKSKIDETLLQIEWVSIQQARKANFNNIEEKNR